MSFCRCIRHNLIAAVQGELTKARLFYRALKLAYSVSFCRCIRHNLIAAVQGERTKNPSVLFGLWSWPTQSVSFCRCIRHNLIAPVQGELTCGFVKRICRLTHRGNKFVPVRTSVSVSSGKDCTNTIFGGTSK